ncbi:hypothetical protein BD414DRAFT_505928 [Trametes punicea]|nr:hypothetical protein BD414DRAFT_505928 [Trametes punicea]
MPMDDELYQNAWSETTTAVPATLKEDAEPSWSPKNFTNPFGEEADLAAPSWSTSAELHWNEPSGNPGFSWSQPAPDLPWGSSVYEGISFGKAPVDETPSEQIALDVQKHSDEASMSPAIHEEETPDRSTPLPPLGPESPETHEVTVDYAAPPSPDGFGSFETGLSEQMATSSDLVEDDPWGSSAWADTHPTQSETSEEQVDEWERARREKLKLDRRVPPELLANIVRQCEELGCDICPELPDVPETESWRNDWRGGMEAVPGLSSFLESFLPQPSLPPAIRFSQSFFAKKMATSVKLTKNLPLTNRSPMSHYLAAKGSTAWETAVKEQKEVVEDDVPVGWRIVEKAAAAPSTDSAKEKKSTGRLFSFWGRRQSQISPLSTATGTGTDSRSPSLEKPRSPVAGEVKSESRQPSQDSVRSSTTDSQTQLPPATAESVELQQSTTTSTVTATPIAPAMSSYSSSPDPVPERSETPPAPSAVSRFLNRFSRRGSTPGNSPRSSLALSSDDLEFLSDIVPSASDDAGDDSADALEKFVNAGRGPTTSSLPPPLAPPPKAPAVRSANITSRHPPTIAQGKPSADDFGTLLGSFSPSNAAALSASKRPTVEQTSAPLLPPPPAPSRPITPSTTPKTSLSVVTGSSYSRPPSRLQASSPTPSSFTLPPPPPFKPLESSNPTTMAPKPQLSSPFPLSKPIAVQTIERAPSSASTSSSRTSYETAAEVSPNSPTSSSPTSSLPLGSLYPHLVTPISPPMASAQPMLPGYSSPKASSPSSDVRTPMASAFSAPGLAPPTQSRPVTSPTAVALTSKIFDDDDFSDFQSPVQPASTSSPPIPPPIAKSPSRHATAVPAARSQTAAPNASSFTLPPPQAPAGSARASSAGPTTVPTSFDDDDFTDFQTSPSSATALKPGSMASSTSSIFPNSQSHQTLLTPKKTSGYDSVDDFFESTLRTPSPPRVPAKLTPANVPLHPPPSSASMPTIPSASSSSSLISRRKSHTAEHLHTLNLMEKASARQGRWPAPPSPLPPAIPGPFPDSSTSSQVNLMDDEAPLAGGSALGPSFSTPAMLSPARSSSSRGGGGGGTQPSTNLTTSASSHSSLSGSLLQGWDFQSASDTQRTGTPPASSLLGAPGNPVNGKHGGLSAQDLSFFESL